MQRADSELRLWCWERQMQKWRGQQRMRYLDSITNSMDMNLSKLSETEENRGAWHARVHGVAKSQMQLSNWITTIKPASWRDNSSHRFRKLRWITSDAACAPCILLGFTSNSICISASISPQSSACFVWTAMPLKGGHTQRSWILNQDVWVS